MANVTRYPQPMVTPLSEAVDRLFRDAFTWPRLSGDHVQNYAGALNSNLYETGDSYIMQVFLPAAKASDLQITAHQNVLTLQGSAGVPAPEGARGIWVGLSGGEFRQQVTLPGEVDADKATAAYDDGVLTITLPKSERSRVKTIKIGASSNGRPALEGAAK